MSWLKAKDWATGVEYSSLFHSGLRAISLRPRARRARTHSSSSSSWEKSSSGGTYSIASLSSRLLRRSTMRTRRTSTNSSRSPLPRTPNVARPRPSSMFGQTTKEMVDAWLSGVCFFEIGDYPKLPYVPRSFDHPNARSRSVRSLGGSRPVFVNLGEMDAITVPPIREESFLSLSNSPDGLVHHPLPRRERPVSMQTSHEFGDEEEIQLDWRQFHVDWVRSIR
ncbi:hypothetical protein HD554DRAFT_2024771 [Boletus coccyginus]|nr:hypothetical protein HD554DRAFT_2024771 [Boletus coccyginus]